MPIINLSKKNFLVFIFSLISVFLMSFLPHLIKIPSLISPALKVDSFRELKPKLDQGQDNFQIKSDTTFVKPVQAGGDFEGARAYGVIDFQSGQVISSQNLDQRLPIASLTKIMSAMVALDLASPTDQFTVSSKAANIEPTRMGVIEGQSWSVEELLNGALLTSANDAVEVLAEGIDAKYEVGTFVRAMNEKAKYLNLKDTQFTNPQGFEGNYSSVADLAKMTHFALVNYPEISQIVSKDYQFLPSSKSHKQADLYNWNGLLGVYPGIKGVKIGNTDEAGYTDIALSERDGHEVLSILLGAPGVLERDLWSSELLDLGFQNFSLTPVGVTEVQLKQKYSTWKYW